MKQYCKALYLLIVIMGIMVACKTKKQIVTQPPPVPIPIWRCEIFTTDVSEFPLVKLKAIVLDENDSLVLNLAPPYGHLNDWDSIWKPLIAEHPQWGKKELIDFKIREIQNIDSIEYKKKVQKRNEQLKVLQIEKDKILTQIQAETRLKDVERMVEERKRNRSQQEIEEARQTSVVLLMDISGSMEGEPLVKAKRAASEFLKFSDAKIAIVAFNDEYHPIMNFSSNKDSLITSFLGLEGSGGTSFYDALYAALDLFKNREGKKHIVAITDGLTHDDSHSMADVIQKALNLNVGIDAKTGDAVKIFTIGFDRENDDLIKMSKETYGKTYFASSVKNFLEAFSDYGGFELEFTFPDISLQIQKAEIQKKMDEIKISVNEEYCYEISFKLPFIVEDGLKQIVSLKFGDSTLSYPVLAPVSTKEFQLWGYITDKTTGDSIPGAIIVVNPEGSDSSYISKSDPSGRYEMLVEKNEGMYSVIVSADHYFIHTEELPLAKKDKYFIQLNRSLPRIEPGINVSLRTIHFEDNEFLFEPVSFNDLISLSNYFVKHPEFVIEVAGHTDSYGKDSYNQWLSERRAETVVEYLTGLGFPESNISWKGFGESNLLVPDDSPENRYINRRVKISLIKILDSK